MYIAMNRFKIAHGSEEAFEEIWKSRERHLSTVPGYIEFHMLRGPKLDDHTLYASHTLWKSHEHFVAWTKSEQFRAAHARAGESRGKVEYLSSPQFEGFEVIIQEGRDGKASAAA